MEAQIRKRINLLKPGESYDLVAPESLWDAQTRAYPWELDMVYASYQYTVTSTGTIHISKSATGEVSVSGFVDHVWWDDYNFHAGLWEYVPNYGIVYDAEAKCLEDNGLAKSFKIESKRRETVSYDEETDTLTWR